MKTTPPPVPWSNEVIFEARPHPAESASPGTFWTPAKPYQKPGEGTALVVEQTLQVILMH